MRSSPQPSPSPSPSPGPRRLSLEPARARLIGEQAELLRRIVREFAIAGRCVGLEPFERGHIHDTFVTFWEQGGYVRRFLHQRLNDKVFTDIPGLMHNIESVTRHLKEKFGLGGTFKTLRLVPTHDQRTYLADSSGPWRTYRYIENTRSYDLCEREDLAREAARAFGQFQAQLIDLDPGELVETIPDFFSSPHRIAQFEDALKLDARGRAAAAAPEIKFVRDRKPLVDVIEGERQSGRMPERVVHGDTKLNNVLFDERTDKALCVVDLDTCMPAYSLYDFGDLVRFTAATCKEDERDLTEAGMDLRLYRALVRGYMESARGFLTDTEVELMPTAARLVTFTLGVRFLTDHLNGDVYFKVHRADHNLDRARVQFRMVESMEQQRREMEAATR